MFIEFRALLGTELARTEPAASPRASGLRSPHGTALVRRERTEV